MTIAADLASTRCPRRRYILRIDGIKDEFWQPDDLVPTPTPSTGRTAKVCLRAPQGHSMNLNFEEMRVDLDQMTFEFDDILDSDGTSYFGKLFAVAKWEAEGSNHWRLKPSTSNTADGEYLGASNVTIPMMDITGITNTENALLYMGSEAIFLGYTLSNATGSYLKSVQRGRYSCVNNGHAALSVWRPTTKSPDYQQAVSDVPFSLYGRRVALYVVTYNESTGAYFSADGALLLWVGRISHLIRFTPSSRKWTISCENILKDLDKQIAVNMPKEQVKPQIRYYNDTSLYVKVYKNSSPDTPTEGTFTPANCDTTPAASANSSDDLATCFNYNFNQDLNINTAARDPRLILYREGGKYHLELRDADHGELVVSGYNHCLAAAGFSVGLCGGTLVFATGDPDVPFRVDADMKPHHGYIALHPYHASNKLILDSTTPSLFRDQGDTPNSAAAYIAIDDAVVNEQGHIGTVILKYTSISTNQVTLSTTQPFPVPRNCHWAGRNLEEDTVNDAGADEIFSPVARQVWAPQQSFEPLNSLGQIYTCNPFELLLLPLLSSGSQYYNDSTYDRLPAQLAVGFDSTLVDITSFISADCKGAEFLADRNNYLIEEPVAFSELLKRECLLFGYAAVWRNGKLTLVDVKKTKGWSGALTLTDDNRARPGEMPEVEQGTDGVINQYKLRIHYSRAKEDYLTTVVVEDADSKAQLGITAEVEIDHPGIYYRGTDGEFQAQATKFLSRRFWRFPNMRCSVSLAPYLLNRIYAGDIVRFRSSYVMDPCGSGVLSTDCWAMVLSVQWDKAGPGSADLMLFPNSATGTRNDYWAPSAIVDATPSWDSNAKTLLLGLGFLEGYDPQDGTAFKAGDKVMVAERCPADPMNAQCWGPLTLAANYADWRLTFSALDDLPGYVNTREYVVFYSNYSAMNATNDQLSRGIWAASVEKNQIIENVPPFKWN